MKTLLGFLLVLLGFSCPVCAQTTSVPKIISDGFAAYKTGGAAPAVDIWFTGSLMGANPTTKTNFVTYLTTFETNNGKYTGYESVGSVTISPSVKDYYLTVLYANNPLYICFEYYTAGGKGVITFYTCNPTSTQILPTSFFMKSKGN